MIDTYIKAFLVGICTSAPIGPVAIYILQKSISKGHLGGFLSSIGVSIIDTLYASICLFALGYAQDFLEYNKELLLIVGGLVVIIVGLNMLFNDPFRKKDKVFKVEEKVEKKQKERGVEKREAEAYKEFNSDQPIVSIIDIIKSGLLALSNPGAILVTFALMSLFGIEAIETGEGWTVAPIILFCSGGIVVYWFLFTWLMSYLGGKIKLNVLVWINRVCGAIVCIFGIALLGQGLYNVLVLGKDFINTGIFHNGNLMVK